MVSDQGRIEIEIQLNRIKQRVVSLEDGQNWFNGLSAESRKSVLQLLNFVTLQAGAIREDVQRAIDTSGLKASYTPCVLYLRGDLRLASAKALNLPVQEYTKLFRLLLSMYSLADDRRLSHCGVSCNHWWHRDLADEFVVDEIREQYSLGNL